MAFLICISYSQQLTTVEIRQWHPQLTYFGHEVLVNLTETPDSGVLCYILICLEDLTKRRNNDSLNLSSVWASSRAASKAIV